MRNTLGDLAVTPAYASNKFPPGINHQLVLTAYDSNSAGCSNTRLVSKWTVKELVVVAGPEAELLSTLRGRILPAGHSLRTLGAEQ